MSTPPLRLSRRSGRRAGRRRRGVSQRTARRRRVVDVGDALEELVDGVGERARRDGGSRSPRSRGRRRPAPIDERRERVLGIRRDHALAGEVLARRERQAGALGVAHPLAVVVEACEPVGEPAGARLEERDAQLGVPLETPPRSSATAAVICSSGCEHTWRAAKPVKRSDPIVGPARTPSASWTAEHAAGLLERVVERRPRGAVEVLVAEVVRAHDHADETELGRATRGLAVAAAGSRGTMPTAGETARVGRAVPGDPVVVRAARAPRRSPRRARAGTGTNSPIDG